MQILRYPKEQYGVLDKQDNQEYGTRQTQLTAIGTTRMVGLDNMGMPIEASETNGNAPLVIIPTFKKISRTS